MATMYLRSVSLSARNWKQEAFEKCWAHSPLRAAARRIAIHQVSLLSHAATFACRLRIDVHDNNDNAWQRGPLWPHRMGPLIKVENDGPHDSMTMAAVTVGRQFLARVSQPYAYLLLANMRLFCCEQVPRIIWQAHLRTADASCGVHIPCEPVRYRLPVVLATKHRWKSTFEVVTVGFTCARRNKQLQWSRNVHSEFSFHWLHCHVWALRILGLQFVTCFLINTLNFDTRITLKFHCCTICGFVVVTNRSSGVWT